MRPIVQPVQLSLLPDQVPAPPPDLLAQLPGPQVTAAITALAGLIARAGQPGDLQRQHDADLPERDLLGQLGKPGPGRRSRPADA